MSIKDVSALDLKDYFDRRMDKYESQLIALRKAVEGLGAEDPNGQMTITSLLQDVLLMLSEDNVVITQVRLDLGNLPSLNGTVASFRDFIDSERFIVKILFDLYNKPYL